MDGPTGWLIAGVVIAGLWSGLLMMVTMVLHPMMRAQDGAAFARQIASFLPVARSAPVNYVCVIGIVVTPAVALAFVGGPGEVAFWLTLAALASAIAGPLLTSRFLAEPNYRVMLAWKPSNPPDGWERIRARYFTLNWVRGAFTWTAFGCLLAALLVTS